MPPLARDEQPLPVRHVQCLSCGQEANVQAEEVRHGVITWPALYCRRCPGYPKMITHNGYHEGGK